MAIAPTAIAVGRFGTYDALAGAAFMGGVSLIVPVARRRPTTLLTAALLLFVAFLAKYLVAIYFPFVCAYLVLGSRSNVRLALRNLAWFVLPLAAACAVYLVVFLGPLLTLLASSLHYGDLASPDPLNEYVWSRPELIVLAIAAALGWRRASWSGRIVGLGGAAVILAFQVKARPDFDFWKHSIYVLFFLAPLAAVNWLRVPQNTGTWRVVAAAGAAVFAAWASPRAIAEASHIIDFYPNLNPAIDDVRGLVAGSHLILTDDTALRYYLYPATDVDRVVGPFNFSYRGGSGLEAYRAALNDSYFDSLVLDGGVTPQGTMIQAQLGDAVQGHYQQVYPADGQDGAVAVYTRRGTQNDAGPAITYQFADGVDGWGGHPDGGDWQAGLGVSQSRDVLWNGQPTARFDVTNQLPMVSLRRDGTVSRLTASIYLVRADGSHDPVRIGLVGFDADWHWVDDNFRWSVTPGTWTTVSWDLPQRGTYHELGLRLPPEVSTAYLGDFEVQP